MPYTGLVTFIKPWYIVVISDKTNLKMIKVDDSVHSEMKSVGAYGESFSDIIAKCVKAFKEKNKK
jgi:hypothetical protein